MSKVEASLAENVLMGRLHNAEDVAQVIAFLASPRSAAVNGVAIDVGGGVRGSINY